MVRLSNVCNQDHYIAYVVRWLQNGHEELSTNQQVLQNRKLNFEHTVIILQLHYNSDKSFVPEDNGGIGDLES